MKQVISLFALIGLLVMSNGCASTSANSIAYKTLASVGATEDAAMKTAASLKAGGTITQAQWDSIAAAHAKYQAAYVVAVNAAIIAVGAVNSGTFPATSDIITLANDVVTLVGALKGN